MISEPINFENCIKTNMDQHSGENANVPVNQIDAPAQENQENGEVVPVVEENDQINNAPPPPVALNGAVNGAVNAGELQATQFDRVMGMFESTMQMMQTQMLQNNEMMKAQMYSQNKLFETLSNTTSQLNSTSSSSNGGAQSKSKPNRPVISERMKKTEWAVFLDAWVRYKKRSKLDDTMHVKEICLELRDACTKEVGEHLYHFIGSSKLNDVALTELKLLEYIKSVAVEATNVRVNRWEFAALRQAPNEPVAKFVARLRSEAIFCEFKQVCECSENCGHEVNYCDEMIMQQLIGGLSNPEHQSRILAESETLKTLDKHINRLVSMEQTDDTQAKIRSESHSRATPISSYTKSKRQNLTEKSKMNSKHGEDKAIRHETKRKEGYKDRRVNPKKFFKNRCCRGCGKKNHGHGKSLARRDCPAFGEKCNYCGMMNHYEAVCDKRKSNAYFIKCDVDDTSDESSSSDEESYDGDSDNSYSHNYAAHFNAQQDFRIGKDTPLRL